MKESFVFYRSFYEAISEVPEESQLELFKAICEYSLNNKLPELENKISKVIFKLIKPNIDSASARYIASVENGKKGGNPNFKRGQRNPYYPQKKDNLDITKTLPKDNLGDNLNVDGDVDDNVDENGECVYNTPTTQCTSPTPTLDELRSYCLENGMEDFNYEKFYNHYESNGWINKNGTEIKNWKAKVRYWYKDDEQNGKLIKHQDTSRRLE